MPSADRPLEFSLVAVLMGIVSASSPSTADALVGAAVAVVTPSLVRADLLHRRLPNELVAVVAAGSCVSTVLRVLDGEWPVAVITIIVMVGWFSLSLACALLGTLGMGDVKLGSLLAAAIAATASSSVIAASERTSVSLAVGATTLMWQLLSFLGTASALGVIAAAVTLGRHGPATACTPGPGLGPGLASGPRATEIAFGPCLLVAYWAVRAASALL